MQSFVDFEVVVFRQARVFDVAVDFLVVENDFRDFVRVVSGCSWPTGFT